MVVQVWHRWLVHGTVPADESWSSVPVSVYVLVILMEHWVLASLPLTVRVRHWWALWKNAADVPVEKIWIVAQCLHVKRVVVHNNRSIRLQTTANTSNHEVHDVEVSDPATGVKILDWKLTNCPQTESNSHLSTRCVVSVIEIRSIHWSRHFFHLSLWEP